MAPYLPALLAVVTATLPLASQAANDWDRPCFQGECFYDQRVNGKITATLRISGSPNSIADITPAGGWAILGCDPHAERQDIRIVCQSANATCAHLFGTAGAQGKLVRLPEECGSSAFARVAANWVHRDQSIPPNVQAQLRRQGLPTSPTVHGIAIDTDFAAIDPKHSGEISMSIVGSTSAIDDHDRAYFESPAFVEAALQGFSKKFDVSKSTDLTLLDVNKHTPIYSKSFNCPEQHTSGSIDVSIDTAAHVSMQIGVVAKGTIIPPKVKEFALFTGLDADLNAKLHLAAMVSGTLDSGEMTLYQVGLPKIEFKDILSIGSDFKVLGKATASLSLGMDATIGLSYQAKSEKLFWPSPKTPSGGNFAPGDVPIKLSMTESITASGTLGVHVIPRIEMGIEAFKGMGKAKVRLDLDASAEMPFNINLREQGSPEASHTPSRLDARAAEHVNGCFKVIGGLDVGAGADAKFFDLFDKSTKVSLFSKRYQIYQKCFNARSVSPSSRVSKKSTLAKRDLTCLASGLGSLVGLADVNVLGSSVSPV